ncbi:hypothetical protein HanXRQr2_Chr14g0663351 [Helianthus annuus]|uniref:Uncharacterized protein n=1 Tax=Helianthus annuus TaxID=4232 RepID=A0A9K3EBE2_HELAN|nr:hypothetical protein HanXRQr2_Chr14g0663351 [Helianthus annuus]KAJ0841990.1 hypothetical protein HanPSC8_Chr14g0636621 [Helianthus annuus]
MEDHMNDIVDTISLSDLQFEDDNIDSSSSSSSSPSSFDQDFLGFFSEKPSPNPSPENIIFCGKIVSSKQPVSKDTTLMFRSTSDSFRFMKTVSKQSTTRSKSVPSLSSSRKSKWHVFMFGFGSGKFPSTMDMSDIKGRQLRRQSTATVEDDKEESVGRRSGKKGWWVLVDVLGCSSGYERDTMVVI